MKPGAALFGAAVMCALFALPRPAPAVDAATYFERARSEEKDGNHKAALEDYEAVIRLKGEDDAVRHDRALIYLKTGNPERAREEAVRAVQLVPKNGRYRITLAVVLMAQAEPELSSARSHLRKAVSIMKRRRDHPGLADAYFNLGVIERQKGRLVRARQYYLLAYDENPADESIRKALSILDPAAIQQ